MGRLTRLISETLASLRRLWFCYGYADGDPDGDSYFCAAAVRDDDSYFCAAAVRDDDVCAYSQTGGYARGQTSEGRWIVSEEEDYEVKKRGPGRPPKQLSVEEEEIRHKKNIQRNRDYRENKKGKFNHLQEQQELFIEFCKEKGITEEFKAFCEKRNLWTTLEENLAANSSSLGAMGARQGKRPATADTTPSCPPIGGFMAEARQNYGQPVAALATQGPLLSTNKGTQIQMINAKLAEKGKISQDALDLQMSNAVTLGWNLKKGLLQSMPPGSEFVNLPLLDTIQRYPSLQDQLNEGLTLIGQGHPIDDKVAMQSDDPPVVVPRSFFSLHNWLESVACEPNVFAPSGDADNIAANARANNVEHEDDATYQRMDEATEADLCVSMWLRDPDGG